MKDKLDWHNNNNEYVLIQNCQRGFHKKFNKYVLLSNETETKIRDETKIFISRKKSQDKIKILLDEFSFSLFKL